MSQENKINAILILIFSMGVFFWNWLFPQSYFSYYFAIQAFAGLCASTRIWWGLSSKKMKYDTFTVFRIFFSFVFLVNGFFLVRAIRKGIVYYANFDKPYDTYSKQIDKINGTMPDWFSVTMLFMLIPIFLYLARRASYGNNYEKETLKHSSGASEGY